MSRIIGGVAGSLRLRGPAKATRPTSDRVKESVFSILESMDVLKGAAVMDLFAGTGALGLEAASRGADSVILVERDPSAAAICRENIATVDSGLRKNGLEVDFHLKQQPVERFLTSAPGADLIFIDPPYDYSTPQLANLLEQLPAAPGAVIVLERSSKSEAPKPSNLWTVTREASYGDTVVYFLSYR